MRILLVEDDTRASHFLARGLSESGLIVDTVADGATGLAYAREGIYDVIVTDRLLPALDGVALVQQLRAGGDTTPVLMLSAVGGLNERVEGIRAGCDDYLMKPYAFVEVLARIEALARRADRSRMSERLECADLVLDTRARTAMRGGREGQVVTRSMLLEAAWNYDFEPRGNIIDMHMHRLRAKVDRDFPVALIHTVVGAGYVLNPAP
jgi:two-component system OmpR family response regulator